MRVHLIALTAAVSVAASPLMASNSAEKSAQRMRQISEVVFQNYPPRAFAAGEQGPVYFIVKLDEKAHPTQCQVTHGSGFPELDAETCALIVRHAVFKSLIGPNGKTIRSTHEGVVNWRIPGTPQPPIRPVALTAETAPPDQICKRTLATGSLYRWERTCMTQREWDTSRAQTQEYWSEYQGKRGDTNCRRGGRTC